MIIGAIARMGMVCEAMIHGISDAVERAHMHDAGRQQRCPGWRRRRNPTRVAEAVT